MMSQNKLAESGTLIVFMLSIESSYSENFERPATDTFDTLQWWIGRKDAWRIKTYAIDSDIHVHEIKTDQEREKLLVLAHENSKKHYGDVIAKVFSINFQEGRSDAEIKKAFLDNGLRADFEWFKSCMIWKPDAGEYTSKTKPE